MDTNRQPDIWSDLRDYLEYERKEGGGVLIFGAGNRGADSRVRPADRLDVLARQIAACTRCDLARTRNRTVPGHGNPQPELLFIGEAPGEQEDRQGLPFVGRAGVLLTRMIERMGMSREEVFIANIIKCRPPGNRTPTPAERATCMPFLEAQIAQLRPKVIVALGATALRGLLGNESEISRHRGVWQEYRKIPLMPTYHPAYLLRNLKARFPTWEDMLKVLERLGRKPPPKPAKNSPPEFGPQDL